MPIIIKAIGQIKPKSAEGTLKDHYKDQSARMLSANGFGKLTEQDFTESQKKTVDARKGQEAEQLLKSIQAQDYVIALDERGKSLTSRQFSSQLSDKLQQSQNIYLLIGGPDGHGIEVLNRANISLNLGSMTWPHRLARILLFEQIYRALTIMTNHPYHRD